MARQILNLQDFELTARNRLPNCIFGFIQGGAEDDVSIRGNRVAFDRISLVPRVMVNTTLRSMKVHTLGREWSAPFAIAPMGAMAVAARDADRVMAQAAAAANIPFVLSGASLRRMEDVIRENEHAWFQAYLTVQEADNVKLIQRVAETGFQTLVITADVAVSGNRENDIRNGYSSPLKPSIKLLMDGLTHPRWMMNTLVRTIIQDGVPKFENFGGEPTPMFSRGGLRLHRRDNLSWESLARVRGIWKHRLVLKGVLSPEDVQQARQLGIDAVIASNHGGRQLDCSIAPLEVLTELVAEAGPMPIMLDSGVRRGTDVLKAMALGSAHVFIGRPFLFAAVVGGQAGVTRAIDLLKAEILRDMALLGCINFNDLATRVRRVA